MQGGLSALMLCCEEGKSETAKLLLDSKANPDLQQSVSITLNNIAYYVVLDRESCNLE